MEIISNNIDETINIAKKLAKYLHKSDVIVLSGDLGAGKTYFTKGIVEYFTNSTEVSSPTFTIVNEYSTSIPVFHFDVYRLENIDEFFNIGGEEYFNQGICLIEWGEKIQEVLPKEYLHIHIQKIGENARKIVFEPHGEKFNTYIKEAFNENTSC